MMNKRLFTGPAASALLLLGGWASAHDVALEGPIEIGENESGYVTTGDSGVIRTGGGECLKLGDWSEESQNNPCEGIEDVAETEVEADPEPEPAPAPEPVEKEPIVTTATLGGEALFNTNSAELNQASEQALADLLIQLERFQEISAIDVTGHTDSRGSDAYNQQLSEQRAQAVQSFLQAAYPNIQVSATGLGETSPRATNSTPEGRQLNRRVDVQVTAKSITEP